jgi:hypothetical protein
MYQEDQDRSHLSPNDLQRTYVRKATKRYRHIAIAIRILRGMTGKCQLYAAGLACAHCHSVPLHVEGASKKVSSTSASFAQKPIHLVFLNRRYHSYCACGHVSTHFLLPLAALRIQITACVVFLMYGSSSSPRSLLRRCSFSRLSVLGAC